MAELANSSHNDGALRGAALGDDPHGEYHSGLDNTDESDFDEEPYGSDESANLSWIAWFCSLKGHEYFCEVPEDFIEDEFNLTGLSQSVNYYVEALDMILDIEDDNEEPLDADEIEAIDGSAEILYGLIHARYILTRNGLHQMADKHENGDFGVCPRYCCEGTYVVPCARTDVPERDSVKLFCPSCLDIYTPPNSRYQKIDGAYFGTTFPHMFFQAFPSLIPDETPAIYTPKIYGFAINEASRTGPRMQWLRSRPLDKPSDDNLGDTTDSQSYAEARDADAPAQQEPPANDDHDAKGSADIKSVDAKTAETKTAETKPADDKSADDKSADDKSADDKSAESMDVGTDKASTPAPLAEPANDDDDAATRDQPMLPAKSPALGRASEPSAEIRRKGSPQSAAAAAA